MQPIFVLWQHQRRRMLELWMLCDCTCTKHLYMAFIPVWLKRPLGLKNWPINIWLTKVKAKVWRKKKKVWTKHIFGHNSIISKWSKSIVSPGFARWPESHFSNLKFILHDNHVGTVFYLLPLPYNLIWMQQNYSAMTTH